MDDVEGFISEGEKVNFDFWWLKRRAQVVEKNGSFVQGDFGVQGYSLEILEEDKERFGRKLGAFL